MSLHGAISHRVKYGRVRDDEWKKHVLAVEGFLPNELMRQDAHFSYYEKWVREHHPEAGSFTYFWRGGEPEKSIVVDGIRGRMDLYYGTPYPTVIDWKLIDGLDRAPSVEQLYYVRQTALYCEWARRTVVTAGDEEPADLPVSMIYVFVDRDTAKIRPVEMVLNQDIICLLWQNARRKGIL